MAVAAPTSPDVLLVLSGLLRDAALLLVEGGTASPADVDTAMRLGAGHPAGPFEVIDSLPQEARERLGLSRPSSVPGIASTGSTGAAAWTGTVGVVGTGHIRDLGKTPISCADSRGFVVNRLLIPFLNDAVRLHEGGIPAEEVDALLTGGAGHPMGPLALIDLIGLDVTVAALESMAAVEADPRFPPTSLLHELVAAGRLGRKSGGGFHSYQED